MNFLLNPIGTVGDVFPYLGIGNVLRARGHRVTIITNPHFEALVREMGFGFAPIGTAEGFAQFNRNPKIWTHSQGWKIALEWGGIGAMRESYEVFRELYVPGETVAAGPGVAFGARIAHEKLGVPLATLHLETYKIRSMYRTPVWPPPLMLWDCVPKISKRSQFWIADRFFIDPFVGPRINPFRKELGLPRARGFLADWWHSPQRVIGMFPDWFYPPQPDWPPQIMLTGFPLWDGIDVTDPPDDLVAFLERGDPPVVFSPGSNNEHAGAFFSTAVEACQRLGCRGVLISKTRSQLPSRLPETVAHFSFAPFSYLLRRSAALVHHAGAGSAAQCLAAGIPHLVMPTTYGTPDIAARLVRLRVARKLRPDAFKTSAVVRELQWLLDSPDVARRCRELAARLKDEKPIERACDVLQELIGSDRSSSSSPSLQAKL